MYMYSICMYVCIYIYIYTYACVERERERDRHIQTYIHLRRVVGLPRACEAALARALLVLVDLN